MLMLMMMIMMTVTKSTCCVGPREFQNYTRAIKGQPIDVGAPIISNPRLLLTKYFFNFSWKPTRVSFSILLEQNWLIDGRKNKFFLRNCTSWVFYFMSGTLRVIHNWSNFTLAQWLKFCLKPIFCLKTSIWCVLVRTNNNNGTTVKIFVQFFMQLVVL